MKVAVNFIRLSCQQTCFIAGKKKIEEEVTCLTAQGKYKATYCMYILCTCTVACYDEAPPKHRVTFCVRKLLQIIFTLDNCEIPAPPNTSDEMSTAAYCLLLPGKLYLKVLLDMKTFRKKGNKEGAVAAFYHLEEEGLGKVYEMANSKGTAVVSIDIIAAMIFYTPT